MADTKDKAQDKYYYALGRRKTSTATVRIYEGEGESTFNGKNPEELYQSPLKITRLHKPFTVTGTKSKYYFSIKAKGGGINGQLDAAVLGIARALEKIDPGYRPVLKKAGLLTRDDRMVERKKTGRPKARRDRQFSKR